MSTITRAFTTKKNAKKLEISDPMPQRSLTARFPQGTKVAARGTVQISSPVELVSTTNMLSYNAPDIRPVNADRRSRAPSAASSTNVGHKASARVVSTTSSASTSADDGVFSEASTPLTTADNSSVGSMSPTEPERNHLSCYFPTARTAQEDKPSIPSRAPSHTKKTHEIMSRRRSSSNASGHSSMSQPLSLAQHTQSARPSHFAHPARKSSISAQTTLLNQPVEQADAVFAAHMSQSSNLAQHSRARSSSRNRISTKDPIAAVPNVISEVRVDPHPFGSELAQVTELAEEFGFSSKSLSAADQEEQDLQSKGFCKFRAEDYISEIQGLLAMAFSDSKAPRAAVWI